MPLQARRRSVAAAAGPEKQPQEQLPYTDRPADVPSSDPWEGEQFEVVGKLASLAIPIIAAAAVGIGERWWRPGAGGSLCSAALVAGAPAT